MKYSEIRSQLKSGDLAFYSSHKTLGDLIIKAWTKSDYSHVGVIWVLAGRVFLLEASATGGVRMVPISKRLPDVVVQMGLKWSPEAEHIAMEHMMDPYSYLDAIRAGLAMGYVSSKGWICTEYAAKIVNACGYRFPDSAQVPQQQLEILSKDSSKRFIHIRG
jgi:hypothetical protein